MSAQIKKMAAVRKYVDRPVVRWYYGKTGTGKTLYAYDTFENIHSCRRLSFPEAKKYENVIFDNYDTGTNAKRSLNNLMVVLMSMEYDNKITKNIVIASIKSAEEIYGGKTELLRRIHVIKHFGKQNGQMVYRVVKNEKPSNEEPERAILLDKDDKLDDE